MANIVDPDQMPHAAASDLGLQCLLRPVSPNSLGKYCMNKVLARMHCLHVITVIVAIAPDKRGYPRFPSNGLTGAVKPQLKKKYFPYFTTNICCGYSLEVPHRGASNEYPQHIFSWRNKKNIDTFQSKMALYLEG